MLRGPDRLHFSSTEILLKITYANHVFLIKDNALHIILLTAFLNVSKSIVLMLGIWREFHWIIVRGRKEYLYTSTLVCNWVSLRGCWARVEDTGVGDGKQWSGIASKSLTILNRKVSLAIVLLFSFNSDASLLLKLEDRIPITASLA